MAAAIDIAAAFKKIFGAKAQGLERALHTKPAPNGAELADAVSDFYANAGFTIDKQRIYICTGPQEAAHCVKSLIESNRISASSKVRYRLSHLARESAEHLSRSSSGFSTDEWNQFKSVLFWDFNFQLVKSVAEPIHSALLKDGFFPKAHIFHPSPFPSWHDWDWILFYDILHAHMELAGARVPDFYRAFLYCGGAYAYTFEQHCVVCVQPSYIGRDEAFSLHADDEAAVSWEDGSKLFFHHGIHVPEKLVLHPTSISKSDIISEENAEVRRCYQEILGSERFAHILGLVLIDEDKDRFGNDLCLYRTAQRDKLAGSFIFFAQVTCTSTGRRYFLCVPPHLRSAKEAVAWSFGKKTNDYHPDIET